MKIEEIIIDASEAPLGRVASFAAKQSLFGKKVNVINCSQAVISGSKKNVTEEFKTARARGWFSQRGPHISKAPERIMKRTIRGMLPYKKGRGVEAFKKIKCYNEIPKEYENSAKLFLNKKFIKKTITLKELSKII